MLINEQKEILKESGILEEDYENCYITDKNQIFTPLKDKDGNIIKTGEQVYNEDYLSQTSLDSIKENKINELSQKCNETIINGFYSDADGTKKLYDFELENQVNLSTKAYQIQIAKLAGQSIGNISYYAKGETCHDYTAEQFLKLAQDGENWKTANIQKYKDKLKPMVLACTTKDDIDKITWESILI